METEYECEYCGNILWDDQNVIFIDRAFMPSGAVFCDDECLLHYLEAYEGELKDIEPLIETDAKYPLTIPHKLSGGDRTEACSEVRKIAMNNDRIYKWNE